MKNTILATLVVLLTSFSLSAQLTEPTESTISTAALRWDKAMQKHLGIPQDSVIAWKQMVYKDFLALDKAKEEDIYQIFMRFMKIDDPSWDFTISKWPGKNGMNQSLIFRSWVPLWIKKNDMIFQENGIEINKVDTPETGVYALIVSTIGMKSFLQIIYKTYENELSYYSKL